MNKRSQEQKIEQTSVLPNKRSIPSRAGSRFFRQSATRKKFQIISELKNENGGDEKSNTAENRN